MDGRVPKLSKVSRLLGSKPRTYMGQFPILAAVDLSPVQPQSCSQQDLSQDYRPASVSSRLPDSSGDPSYHSVISQT